MATQPTEEGTFSLFEEGGFASSKGHSGYRHQPNKPPPPTLGDRCQFLMTGEVEEDDSPTWVAPASMGFLVLMSFIAFVLSCVGVDMARSNSRSVSQMKSDLATLKKQVVSQQQEHHSSTYDCSQGDIIWGQTPLEGSVAWYQLIGGSKATLTWFEVIAKLFTENILSLVTAASIGHTLNIQPHRTPLTRLCEMLKCGATTECEARLHGLKVLKRTLFFKSSSVRTMRTCT